jgi:hypothetical protein
MPGYQRIRAAGGFTVLILLLSAGNAFGAG